MTRFFHRVTCHTPSFDRWAEDFGEGYCPMIEVVYSEREHVKESTMGSYESVKKISACYHDWKPRPAILFGYIPVDAQCAKCETWWAPPADRS